MPLLLKKNIGGFIVNVYLILYKFQKQFEIRLFLFV